MKQQFEKCAWQNTGMRDQVIFEYLRPVGAEGTMTELSKDGKVNVFTFDRKWGFEVRLADNYHAIFITKDPSDAKHVIDLAYSASSLPFYGMANEDCGNKLMFDTSKMDNEDCWLSNCKELWISVLDHFNELYATGYVYVWNNWAKMCLEKLIKACGINAHFDECYDHETHEDGWFVCNDELWHQLGKDVEDGRSTYFCFSEDAIDAVCHEVNGTCDRVLQKIAMQCFDGAIEYDMGYRIVGDVCC